MKTKFGTKLISLLLCVCMLIPMFTACGNKDNDKDDDTPLSWEATEDQVIPLEMDIQNGESNTTLVLTYGEDIFSSIENEQIKLTVYQKAASSDETAESTESSITERTPTDFTASVTNAKQLTITVPSTENDWGYLVAVHSSAISSGKFGEAYGFNSEVIEEYISYSATISGEYATGDVNPVITVTLENTVAAAGLTKEMITLTGLFEGLEITSVSGSESTVTIVTSGTIAAATPFFAGVELAEGATNSGVALSADCEVAYRSAYVKQDSFALASGILTFDAVIASDTVTLAVNDTLTADGITYTVKAVSEDKTTVTLGVATTASDLDSAIAEINGKALEIPANKTASANAHTLTVYAFSASVGGSIDYIEETSTANTYSATAILFVKNGVWNGTLTASDITLGGDFDGATVTSVAKDGDSYEIVFTFVKEGLDLDDISLEGTATIAANKVKNAWGTTLAENDATLTYVTGLDRGETWDAIKAFVDSQKGNFETIKTVGSAVSGIASAAGGVVSILEIIGVLESTDDKLDNINERLDMLSEQLAETDAKVERLGQMMAVDAADQLNATQWNTYLVANNGWNSFLSSYVAPLSNMLNDYKMACNDYMLNYINQAGRTDSITVYIDENGKVTLPGTIDGYSIDGLEISAVIECSLSAELSEIKQKVIKNKGRLYAGYWDEIKATEISLKNSDGEPITSISKADYFTAVEIQCALYAMNTVGVNNILNTYKNFCDAIAGNVGGSSGGKSSLTPLDYYTQMMSMYYNFYCEAKNDIDTTRAWLDGLLYRAADVATLAYDYTPSAEEGLINQKYELACNEINSERHEKADMFCYIVNAELDVRRVYGWVGHCLADGVPEFKDYDDHYLYEQNKIEWKDQRWFHVNNSKHMGEKDILLLQSRYKRLRDNGIIESADFETYLKDLGLTRYGGTPDVVIITGNAQVKNTPKDNSVTATIYYDDGDWYKVGDKIKIGNGDKVSAEYFSGKGLYLDLIKLDGTVKTSCCVNSSVRYDEDHFYWRRAEYYLLEYEEVYPVMLFFALK